MSDRKIPVLLRRPTQHDRARVWERVVAERARGDRWREIAERAGLSTRQCRRIWVAHAHSAPTRQHSDLICEIDAAISGYDADIEQLALISASTRSEVARVAAIRARIATRSRKLELLQVAGVLDGTRTEHDVRAVARAVMRAFDEHGVTDEARRAVLAALRPEGAARA